MEQLRLSVYDQSVEQLYVSRIFFYERAPDPAALRDSLARTLKRFPIFSGRLLPHKRNLRSIEYSDRGVVFETIHVSGKIPGYGPEESALPDFDSFIEVPTLTLKPVAERPLLHIRLTLFEEGGAAMAIRSSHAVTDGRGFYAFMLAWASEHQGRSYTVPAQSRGALDAIGEGAPRADTNPRNEVLRPVRFALFITRLLWHERQFTHALVRFSAERLATMKAAAMGELDEGQWVSTNDVLSAHLWQALAAEFGGEAQDIHTLALVRTLRQLTDPPLGPDFFGNSGVLTPVPQRTEQLAKATLSELALRIRESYALTSPATICEDTAFLLEQRRRGRLTRTLSRFMRGIYTRSVMVNNWSQLPMYELNFGHGKPFWAEFPSPPIPMFILAPTPQGENARDVRISLPKAIMPGLLRRLR